MREFELHSSKQLFRDKTSYDTRIKTVAYQVVPTCSFICCYQRVEEVYFLHLQGLYYDPKDHYIIFTP
jgi:hypothetical protein